MAHFAHSRKSSRGKTRTYDVARKFSQRASEDFNIWRALFQKLVCHCVYWFHIRIRYRLEVVGNKNFDKSKPLIVTSNHVSALDAFILAHALSTPIAYMTKEELFQNFFTRLLLDWGGAFAVNRKKLEVSTIKTALSVTKTNWNLGLFPQGTRKVDGNIENVSKGFASLAKATKSNILPVAIIGAGKNERRPFTGRITVKIGEIIPFSDNIDELVEKWHATISELRNS